MAEERDLKMMGEELAGLAVESGMAMEQLQTIYRLIKKRPMAFVQAHIKRQIGRCMSGVVSGAPAFTKLLELCEKYEMEKDVFEKVLVYAIMLYDYVRLKDVMKFRTASEQVIREVVSLRGATYERLNISSRRDSVEFRVKIKRFHGNRRDLALDIKKALKAKIPELEYMNLKIWIEKAYRR